MKRDGNKKFQLRTETKCRTLKSKQTLLPSVNKNLSEKSLVCQNSSQMIFTRKEQELLSNVCFVYISMRGICSALTARTEVFINPGVLWADRGGGSRQSLRWVWYVSSAGVSHSVVLLLHFGIFHKYFTLILRFQNCRDRVG